MGESMKSDASGGRGGLMVALAQALTMEMSAFKVAIFETLCAAAQWPSLKGRIAGSGVLGVITATLLSPKHPVDRKALMTRLTGLLGSDSPEVLEAQHAQLDRSQHAKLRRATEFAKLRQQLISSGAVKAIVALLDGDAVGAAAAAKTISQLAGIAGDEAIRVELAGAEAISAMLKRLERFRLLKEKNELNEDENEHEDLLEDEEDVVGTIVSSLSDLALVDGCEELLAPVHNSLNSLCGALHACNQRKMIGEILRCLETLGSRYNLWPEMSKELAEDIFRLLLMRSSAAVSFLETLLRHAANTGTTNSLLSEFGDVRPLRRALLELGDASASTRDLIATIDSHTCEHCGKSPTSPLMVCSKCRQVKYCSRECQRTDWKRHKLNGCA